MHMDEKINELFLGIDSKVNIVDGKKIRAINFDNAATTPPFKNILETMIGLSDYYGSIGRGAGHKAEITTRLYYESKNYIMDFFNIKDKDKYTVIYVSNTTSGINRLSRLLKNKNDDIILSTRMEHHSNDLPWRRRWNIDYIEVDKLGRLKLEDIEKKLVYHKGKVKYITVTGASNVTGYINDIHAIAKIAHKYDAKIIVDGAQLIPHLKVDMSGNTEEECIDFLVFSGHKLYAPFGVGVIIGLKEVFDKSLPDNEGGGTVKFVMDNEIEYLESPEKEEAGTPNFFGAIAISNALSKLDEIEFKNIHESEVKLRDKLLDGLNSIPGIINYGDVVNREDRLGIGVFNIKSMYHQDVAETLAKYYGISVRQGWFCAHPYCRRLMHISEKSASAFIHDVNEHMPGMIRVSFGIYNQEAEVDYFLECIERIIKKSK
ncbi:aminotransferase class V-fold PLP-dependent enzyme [Clostridium sp. SHJSY1]|uniref:aminotransferase class V-fold PLP-dependent enzyme n=1 Tax=Clostridium sp. SHJSY1 TaxID=2942483 RepID=UPI00287490C4|nr:aminotransferase class V-fold PLP-dependent enzyme [Clostridium sp. SHJSY1]MDS0524163.1 aminotransferase class V-fold PLP-dependent enzyme [Clostridium sp. SHJSY1]